MLVCSHTNESILSATILLAEPEHCSAFHAGGIPECDLHHRFPLNYNALAQDWVSLTDTGGAKVLTYGERFIAIPITQVFAAVACAGFMWLYILIFRLHEPTWVPLSFSNLKGMVQWCQLAIPGMTMRCAEWWTFEINIVVSGLLGVNELAAMTLLFNVMNILYTIPLGFAIAAAAKVGNAVGAEDIKRARRSSFLIIVMTLLSQSLFATLMLVTDEKWPLIFISDPEVTQLVSSVVPLIAGFCLIDAFQTSIGGILRGAGKQTIGAITYIGSYYVVGMSVGLPLALVGGFGLEGLWIGITCASSTSLIVLGGYFIFMSWHRVILESAKRLNPELSRPPKLLSPEPVLKRTPERKSRPAKPHPLATAHKVVSAPAQSLRTTLQPPQNEFD